MPLFRYRSVQGRKVVGEKGTPVANLREWESWHHSTLRKIKGPRFESTPSKVDTFPPRILPARNPTTNWPEMGNTNSGCRTWKKAPCTPFTLPLFNIWDARHPKKNNGSTWHASFGNCFQNPDKEKVLPDPYTPYTHERTNGVGSWHLLLGSRVASCSLSRN